MKRGELKEIIRQEIQNMFEAFKAKNIPAGTSWKVGAKGWAAKDTQGNTNYWYGGNEQSNKTAADAWAHAVHAPKRVREIIKEKVISKLVELRNGGAS